MTAKESRPLGTGGNRKMAEEAASNVTPLRRRPRSDEPERMSPELVDDWHDTLMQDDEWTAWWTDVRGVQLEILRERRVGVQGNRSDAPEGFRYTIPVWDASGQLVDVKKYAPGATDRKNIHTRGHGRPCRLYGVDWVAEPDMKTDEVWVFGGEPDALRGISAGLLAVSGTSGEGSLPRDEDMEHLRGFDVNVCLDMDDTGRAGANKWVTALLPLAASVKNIAWPANEGKDVTDWLNNGHTVEELRKLADAALPVATSQRPLGELLDWALNKKLPQVGSRNQVGFDLACQLRDEQYSREEAERFLVESYVPEVGDQKDHPYTADDARASLHQAYSQPRRDPAPRGRDSASADDKHKQTVAEKLYQIALDRYRFGKTHDGRLIAVPNADGDPNLARIINKGNGALSDELAALYATRHAGKVPARPRSTT